MADLLKPEVWTSSSNECLKLFITTDGAAINFQPSFTYPIFGDSESIFGFKNLVIFLCFDHYTFYPFLNVKYDEKLDDDTIKDPKETMMKFLPESTVFKDEVKWVDEINKEYETYNIPGEMISQFETYKIYKINLKDLDGIELQKRLQILVLLFIEAGSFIDYKDELWDLYVIYEESETSKPSIVGFTTVYNYWKYPGSTDFDNGVEQIRKKISQFVILPNYQGKSIGSKFYTHLYEFWLKDPKIIEIVVEDPNESFDDMRDKADLTRLKSVLDLKSINFEKLSKEWIENFRSEQKLEKRQFNRLIEMILLNNYKTFNNLSLKQIRLFIKKRLYEKNKEALLTLDKPTRFDKLQTAYQSLEEDYYRILGGVKLYTREGETIESSNNKRAKLSV
ncbi:histone acetyltransferase type B catalytic subunit [[Candida] jaroonii]|uniref:Histone acetyltransferase type B catalytic subunit n=1 Tax=[Candida] jaroonii TaxID=467808 RepID=A0ACA9YF56_9ASCO|nr:histone acetyltransferase type B catalytic subunit [[Candida] jaroonii]